MDAELALAIKREARWGNFKDTAYRIGGVGAGLALAFAALFGAVFLFDYIAGYEDRLREERLHECVTNAQTVKVAVACGWHWGPEDDDENAESR